MSTGLFDISRSRQSDGSYRESVREVQASLVSEAIEELSAMSFEEMEATLRSIEEQAGQDPSSKAVFTEAFAEPDPLGKTVSIEEVYKTPEDEVEERIESFENDAIIDDVVRDMHVEEFRFNSFPAATQPEEEEPETTGEAPAGDLDPEESHNPAPTQGSSESLSSEEETPAGRLSFEAAAPTSIRTVGGGVIKDEIVLALLHAEVVTMAQVFTALKYRKEGEDLWRVLADLDGLDRDTVFAAVARHSGYKVIDSLDSPPSREFVEHLIASMETADLNRVLDAGLLPVMTEPSWDPEGFRLILASTDPLSAKTQTAILSSPINIECRFAPANQVWTQLGQVMELVEELATQDTFLDPLGAEASLKGSSKGKKTAPKAETAPRKPAISPESIRAEKFDAEVNRDRVVKSLLKEGSVTHQQVLESVAIHQSEGGRNALWRILADHAELKREDIYSRAATVYAFRHEVLEPGRPDHDFVRLTMETLASEHREELLDMLVLPFEHEIDYETGQGRIIFVTPDPTRPSLSKLLHELDLGRFELAYASESSIRALANELFPRKNEYLERMTDDTQAYDLGMSYEEAEGDLDEEALEAEINRSKLINLFEAALVEAVRQGVSDIHVYPNSNRKIEIHFRVDGRLKKWHTEDKVHPEAFLAVVKDNSTNVDRFERDKAQDGFIQRDIDGALIRFRVSILPIATANQELRAESVVIRILDDRKVLTDIRKLGMLDSALQRFNQAIRQPHGMVILTGPTGSGKSTTLVAALHQVVTSEVNVLTVEDPVEYIIKGVRQIKLSHKLDLEGALRSILRHDPDIVMVGEMRDKETAELAIKLANTGHLTFSTLHTNDAPAAVSRLFKMGIEPFLIAYAINLVVAQRLAREVCSECKQVDEAPDQVLMRSLGFTDDEIETTTVYRANRGSMCPTCHGHGYKGRRAVCEALYFSPKIRHMIAEAGSAIDEDAIRKAAQSEGMLTLADSARELVKMGVTTLEEMLRVTMSE